MSFRCYLDDDVSDDAFRAGPGSGSGVFVGEPDDRAVGDCGTFAAFVLDSIEE